MLERFAVWAGIPLLVLLAIEPASAAAVGEVLAARGAVTVQSAAGTARLVARGDALENGDIISTARKSFTILRFDDGTRMSLRPNTVFKVEKWSAEPRQESAVMRLFRGGLRAVTGFIAERNSRAFRVNTSVATIGIRGTTFDARLCDGDECRDDARGAAASQVSVSSRAVGRVAFVKGDASARKKDSTNSRPIISGSPLYEGDTVATTQGSFAILVFSDRSRVTLRSNTVFVIEAHQYREDEAEDDSSIFRLVRGGLRAVTGLIGKRNAARVRYRTAVATIGIRGTGFDLECIEACGTGGEVAYEFSPLDLLVRPAHAQQGLPPGLIARPFLDTIYAIVGNQRHEIAENQVFFFPAANPVPQQLPALPRAIPEPRPDEVELDEAKLFRYRDTPEGEPGLHVACIEGTACAVGDEILAAGESYYEDEDGNVAIRARYVSKFLYEDEYFQFIGADDGSMGQILDGDPDVAGECAVAL